MVDIIYFVGRQDLVALENLAAFILHAKNNCPFGIDIWDGNSWDITTFNIGKNQGRTRKVAHFKSVRDPSGSKSTVVIPFEQPFLEFAKAAFSEIMRRFQLQEFRRYLYALQAIEQALIDSKKHACITSINANILDDAAQLITARFQDGWSTGRCLERLVTEVILPARLVAHNLSWKSPIPYKQPARNDRIKSTKSTDKKSRLPSLQSILDLAEIHHTSQHIPDRITTSFVTLAMFAPSRASEILSLPVNCVTQAESENGPMMGIAWRPAKGGMPLTKFAASENFEKVVLETIEYIKQLGASARVAAEWYAMHPGQLYLPPGFEHLRGQPVTLFEAGQILGKKKPIHSSDAPRYGLSKINITTNDPKRRGAAKAKLFPLYSFVEFEAFILAKLPAAFPILDGQTGMKWHEALFVIPEHSFRPGVEPHIFVPTTITTNQINNQLGANPGGNTIFSRHNRREKDGSPIAISTHDFRHLLNTLAQSKHLSESLIAFWSGRKSLGQNEWYDHLPQEAFIEAYLNLSGESGELDTHGPIATKVNDIALQHGLTRKEALKVELGSTHRTRYGICRHDYALTPCPKDKDCVNCGEHTFVKGDFDHKAEAEFQFEMHEKAVLDAQAALSRGEAGATRWIKLHEPKLARWQMVLDRMNDQTIPDGTLITLPPPVVAQAKTGLSQEVRLIEAKEIVSQIDVDEEALMTMEFF